MRGACPFYKGTSGVSNGDKAGTYYAVRAVRLIDRIAPVTIASPTGGSYGFAQIVTLTADEPVTIFYTTNGSDPKELSSVYSIPITISATTTLKFFAKDKEGNLEQMKTQTYTIDRRLNGIHGDLDGDSAATLADAIIGLQVIVGLKPPNLRSDYTTSNADVSGAVRIGFPEAIYILQKAAGAR